MNNREEKLLYVQKLLKKYSVEELAQRADLIKYCYRTNRYFGIVVNEVKDSGENYEYGCTHFYTGHEQIQKIKVEQKGYDIVALYKVIKMEGKCEMYRNGEIRELKLGETVKIRNGDEYCIAGDVVVAEVFEPVFSKETHISIGSNPMLGNGFGVDFNL